MDKTAELSFLITMEMAYKFLQAGSLSDTEYSQFLNQMNEKYRCEKVFKLYQSMLDIYLIQSSNSDTKGA